MIRFGDLDEEVRENIRNSAFYENIPDDEMIYTYDELYNNAINYTSDMIEEEIEGIKKIVRDNYGNINLLEMLLEDATAEQYFNIVLEEEMEYILSEEYFEIYEDYYIIKTP